MPLTPAVARRPFPLLAVLAVLVVPLPAAAKTTITFMMWGDPGFMRYHDLVGAKIRFEMQHPDIEIEILQGSANSNAYVEQILVMNASGSGLDVITAMPHWDITLAHDGVTRDLAPFMEQDGLAVSDFVPGTIQGFMLDSKIWGLPLAALVYGSAYNARLMDEAGYAPPPPHAWTWNDVLEVGRRLTVDQNGDGVIDQYGIEANRVPSTVFFYPLVHQAGGLLFDRFVDPRESRWNTPPVREAVSYYLSLFENGYAPYRTHAYGQLWSQNKAAFLMLNASSTWGSYKMLDRTVGHHDIVSIPAPKGPVRGGWEMTAYGAQMTASTKYPEAAWTWIKYLVTSTEEVKARYETGEVLMSSYMRNVPLFLEFKDAIVDPQIWIDIASDPDNTPRYSLRKGREITDFVHSSLASVLDQRMSLAAALEEIHRVAGALLAEAHAEAARE